MNRRDLLKSLLLAAPLAPGGCQSAKSNVMTESTRTSATPRTPVIFLAHGSPLLLEDQRWASELATWAASIGRPRAILMLSAHWVDAPITLGATSTVPLVYDFYGFPEHHYQVKYPAPGAPKLAARLRELLRGTEPLRESTRGLDHGAYVPLVCMYPQADVPVLQVSLPSLDARRVFELGRALAPLRDEGVLIVGSGFLTHNLGMADLRGRSPAPLWAKEFDDWAAGVLSRRDVDALLDYRARAPAVDLALPTHEHFVPVLAALGASATHEGAPKFPVQGFAYGSMTRRSVQWG
jgi:4,5-DOPA dioxygenase extradiol